MRVYAYATLSHYADHLMPIVDALRDRMIDVEFLTGNRRAIWGEYVHPTKLDPRGVWMVASKMDADRMGNRPYIYVEHGAGQTYDADERGLNHPSYSSGRLPGQPVLFICPNRYVATRRQRMHPDVPTLVAGCPKLDHLHAYARGWHPGVEQNVVAFAFHWNCQVVPEAMTAWEHYRPHLLKVVLALHRRGIRCVSHAHPRIARQIRYHTERMGMEWWDWEDVLTRAAVLCWDNTSLGYEFASLDRPTVILNAPWYRRHVHHGLRFWECLPGYMVDRAEDLPDTIDATFDEADESADLRECIDRIYPLRDGHASDRSADAICALLSSRAW